MSNATKVPNRGEKTTPSKDIIGAVLVVGGGISGMQSALDLAESGFRVYLVESSPGIGGWMAKLDKTFPTNDCAMCIMAPKLVGTGRHHNIQIISNSELEEVSGKAGKFKVRIRRKARYIKEDKCTGCGLCAQWCPIEAINEYDEKTTSRSATYVKYAQTVPLVFTIDKDACIGCGLCAELCEAGAIDYDMKETLETVEVGSIILSPGYKTFDPSKMKEYGYGTYTNVVTSGEFERALSATGPFQGHVLRPSDGKHPRKIAFLQCVGSRDTKTNPYCSGVCCMYSIKEAIIAKEHYPKLEPTIFFMDIRAHGKEFENYYNRAQDEYGVQFVRGRVASIEEDPSDEGLFIEYCKTGSSKPTKTKFDMVVLATGFEPPEGVKALAKTVGIDLNQYNFAKTNIFHPFETSRPGIFVSGAFSGPKDIPETVAQASGAAAKASSVISDARGTMVSIKEYPPEKDVSGKPARLGVFICHCGINIGSVVNVPEVVKYAKSLPNVVYAEHNLYTCSQDTQEKIKSKIKEYDLTRVVVASCTPRTHEPLFQNTCHEAGLNPYLFEMANIREHCSWVHSKEKERATEKAKDLVRMAVAKATKHESQTPKTKPVIKSGLVIGGGLSGMTAALGLAEQGFQVYLVEKEKVLGGHLRHIQYLYKDEEDPQKALAEMIDRVKKTPKIKLFLESKVTDTSGSIGAFKTQITGPQGATEVDHGVVLITSGGIEYRPTEYLYGRSKKVITQSELEEKIVKKSIDLQKMGRIVIVQCIGARDKDNPNCSRICCNVAVKNSLKLKELAPKVEIVVLYKDIRTYGFIEDNYREARGKGVQFMRYDEKNKPKITESGDKISITAHDDILDKDIVMGADLLVLSAAIHPNPNNKDLSTLFKIPLTKDGFFLEAHMKLRPVDFATDGIFLAGLAHGPKTIAESISQSMAAVSRAITILSKDEIISEAIYALVDTDRCVGCGTCEEICEYGAPKLIEAQDGLFVSNINEILCKGCGACAIACPSRAISMKHFKDEQIDSIIDTVFKEVVE